MGTDSPTTTVGPSLQSGECCSKNVFRADAEKFTLSNVFKTGGFQVWNISSKTTCKTNCFERMQKFATVFKTPSSWKNEILSKHISKISVLRADVIFNTLFPHEFGTDLHRLPPFLRGLFAYFHRQFCHPTSEYIRWCIAMTFAVCPPEVENQVIGEIKISFARFAWSVADHRTNSATSHLNEQSPIIAHLKWNIKS